MGDLYNIGKYINQNLYSLVPIADVNFDIKILTNLLESYTMSVRSRCVNYTFLFVLIVSSYSMCGEHELKMVALQPEFYTDIFLTNGYTIFQGLGVDVAGGVRLDKRHFIQLDLKMARLSHAITDVAAPPSDYTYDLGATYYFAPIILHQLLVGEIGLRVAAVQDEYRDRLGYIGFPARISLGNGRIAGYVSGIMSLAGMVDMFGGYWPQATAPFSIGVGIRCQPQPNSN